MDNIFNTNGASLAKVLLIFYVIVASNFTSNLMGKQLKTFLEESRLSQHIIAFIMMLVLIIIIGNVNNTTRALVYAIIGYLWFIFTTKLDIHWNLIIILALLVLFLYENNLVEKERQAELDNNLTSVERENIRKENSKIRMYVISGVIMITIFGMFLYLMKKEIQYGGGEFDIFKFIFY